jgi:hypothetical protein
MCLIIIRIILCDTGDIRLTGKFGGKYRDR